MTSVSDVVTASFVRTIIDLLMEAVSTSETSVTFRLQGGTFQKAATLEVSPVQCNTDTGFEL
jgi:hypothetical protein